MRIPRRRSPARGKIRDVGKAINSTNVTALIDPERTLHTVINVEPLNVASVIRDHVGPACYAARNGAMSAATSACACAQVPARSARSPASSRRRRSVDGHSEGTITSTGSSS
jgi:hypothetical protein